MTLLHNNLFVTFMVLILLQIILSTLKRIYSVKIRQDKI